MLALPLPPVPPRGFPFPAWRVPVPPACGLGPRRWRGHWNSKSRQRGKIIPGNLLGRLGQWRSRGNLNPGVGWGGKDRGFLASSGLSAAELWGGTGWPLSQWEAVGARHRGGMAQQLPGLQWWELAVSDVWAARQHCISTRKLRPLGPCGFGSFSSDVGQPQSPLPPHGASQLWKGAGEGGSEPGRRGVM